MDTPNTNLSQHEPEFQKSQHSSSGNLFWEVIKFALLALIIVIPIRFFIASPYIVSGASMEPTFNTGDYLIVDQLSYRFDDPKRGDVIVFRYPNDTSKFFIKRIIGLPEEKVLIEEGQVFIQRPDDQQGFLLSEPYVEFSKADDLIIELENDEYFVMGDNRGASSDSRSWGPLGEEFITGEVFARLFPIGSIDLSPGEILY